MSLEAQLTALSTKFQETAPEPIKNTVLNARTEHAKVFDYSKTIQPGQNLPPFTLTDAQNKSVSSSDLLASGPLLIVFYRGSWCPFCNLTLHSLQQHFAAFEAKNVTLVAISPELPDTSLTAVEKHELQFPVLTDLHNEYAEKLGIVYHQPESMRAVFDAFGNDLKVRNGSDTLDVPVPTTLLVDQAGVVRNAFVETDYTKRLETKVALEWIEKL